MVTFAISLNPDRGYKTLFMFNATEHELSTTHKLNKQQKNKLHLLLSNSFKVYLYHFTKMLAF